MIKPKLTFKMPNNPQPDLDRPLRDCLLELRTVAKNYGCDLIIEHGNSISPISVSGDLSLKRAEQLKVRALRIVQKWKTLKRPIG